MAKNSVPPAEFTTPPIDSVTEEVAIEQNRIPDGLSKHAILVDLCRQYIDSADEIAAYNKEVLTEKDAEWTIGKVLEQARELGRPADINTPANEDIKTALEAYEEAIDIFNSTRKAVLNVTSEVLGISLSATSERNSEAEIPLREKRKYANEIGNQLSTIAGMLSDKNAGNLVKQFLIDNPLPAVGRDQARTFGVNEQATPKYRVTVQVFNKDGEELVNQSGFTNGGLALTKFYERGKALKSTDLRNAWEKAGNTAEKTVTSPVEFEDNDLHFVITKK